MGRNKGSYNTYETYIIAEGNVGDYFYSDKPDKTFTASATYYKRKIKTERLIAVTSGKLECKANYIVKVTIIE